MVRTRFGLFILLCAIAQLYSCASIQGDTLASTDRGEFDGDLETIGNDLVALDSESIRDDRDRRGALVRDARERINALGKSDVLDSAFQARLAAYSGRLALAEGRDAEAARMLKKAEALAGDGIDVLILKARLERDPDARSTFLAGALARTDGGDALRVEQALALLELKRYREAIAAFDASLPRLGPAYADAYGDARERAWRLRDVSSLASGDVAAIAASERVSWRDVVAYASRETALLDFFTGGKDVPPEELLKRLAAKGYVPAAASDEPVTRSLLSQFLWRLVAELRADPSLLDKYTRRYASRAGAASPIPDVPVNAPFFDAALGCVEWEIMSLPDGRSFIPDGFVSGAAYVQMLKKIR